MAILHTYYDDLGVPPDAKAEEIQAAWRRQVGYWHPDRNQTKEAMDRAQAINNAHDVLGDVKKRAAYDLEIGAGREQPSTAGAARGEPWKQNRETTSAAGKRGQEKAPLVIRPLSIRRGAEAMVNWFMGPIRSGQEGASLVFEMGWRTGLLVAVGAGAAQAAEVAIQAFLVVTTFALAIGLLLWVGKRL